MTTIDESPIKTVQVRRNGSGIKTINVENFPAEAWRIAVGEDNGGDLSDYYHKVPWAFRAIDLCYNAVLQMPFSIYKGDTEIDSSKDYKNVVKFLPNPGAIFGLVEAAIQVWGKAYLFKRPNIINTKTLAIRYLLPTSINAEVNKDTGAISFVRDNKDYTTDQIIYFWKPDPFVEIGPPKSGALTAAASAAGVLLNVDLFAAKYFERGAVKATILAVEGNPDKTEKERIKSLWQRVMAGIKSAYGEMVINAKSMTPTVIGEGLEALADKGLTAEKREAIASALGIPHSKLFSSSAGGLGGGGVAEQDDLSFYQDKIVPDCRFIESVLNPQLFEPAGYKLKFNEQALDMFQEDEAQRADSLAKLQTALADPETFLLASKILGYELDPKILKEIEALIAAKEERRKEMSNIMPANQPPQMQGNNPSGQPAQEPPPSDEPPAKSLMLADLARWQRKAEKRIKVGKPQDAAEFDSDHIPADVADTIRAGLLECKSVDDVRAVFAHPEPARADLAQELQRANDLLEKLANVGA